MTENRFAVLDTLERVLWALLAVPVYRQEEAIGEALARIRELTPPTVSEEARERACRALEPYFDAVYERKPSSASGSTIRDAVDRTIDALGYTPAPAEKHGDGCGCYHCDKPAGVSPPPTWDEMRAGDERMREHCADPVSPPVVELDAVDLQALARLLTTWSDLALHLGVDVSHRLPIGYGDIRQREDDGAWVLRIGGGDE